MDAFIFLKSLPAVLGLVGFFAYLWWGQARIGGEQTKSIIAKLRTSPNLPIHDYGVMTPARIAKLVETDANVRRNVNDDDVKLLRLIILLQNIVTVIVLVVCAALVGVGIWLVSQPERLAVLPQPPHSLAKDAGGLLVDTDPLKVEWSSTGMSEPVSVYIENVDSGDKTPKKSVAADVRSVTFDSAEVRKVATDRQYEGKNRIRTVVEWSSKTVQSEVVELLVGINVQLMLNGKAIEGGVSRPIDTLVATIDDSTQGLPQNYCFKTDVVGRKKDASPIVIVLPNHCNNDTEIKIPQLKEIDWDRRVGLVYDGPDDRRIVRTCVSGQLGLAASVCQQ